MIRCHVHMIIWLAVLCYGAWALWNQFELHEAIAWFAVGWFSSKAAGCCLVCNRTAKWDDIDYEPRRQ